MRRFWKGVTAKLDLRVTRPLLRSLPLRGTLDAIRIVAVFSAPFSPTAWRLALAGVLPGSPSRVWRIGYLCGVAVMDKYVWRYKADDLRDVPAMLRVEGREHLDAARRTGRGLILVTLHGPEFRLLQHWVNQADPDWRPYLVKYIPGPDVMDRDRLIHQEQERIFAGRLLDIGFGIRQAIKVLRAGGTILITQDTVSRDAAPVRILGRPFRNTLGAARLAELTDAVILPVVVAPALGRPRWVLRFWLLLDPRDGANQGAAGPSLRGHDYRASGGLGKMAETPLSWDNPVIPATSRTTDAMLRALAVRLPDRAAVRGQGRELTFSQLDAQTLAMAEALRGAGIAPGRIVALDLPVGLPLLLAFLAVTRMAGWRSPCTTCSRRRPSRPCWT